MEFFRLLILLVCANSLFLSSAFSDVDPIPLVDAENLVESASLVAGFESFVNSCTDFCSRAVPDSEFSLKMANAVWREGSIVEILAAEELLKATPQDEREKLRKLANEKMKLTDLGRIKAQERLEFCKNFAASIFAGYQSIEERMPKAAEFLQDEFFEHPNLQEPAKREKYTVDCLKKLSNERYRNWQRSSLFCRCNTESIFRSLSSSDFQLLEKASAEGRGNAFLESLPKYATIRADLSACVHPTTDSTKQADSSPKED